MGQSESSLVYVKSCQTTSSPLASFNWESNSTTSSAAPLTGTGPPSSASASDPSDISRPNAVHPHPKLSLAGTGPLLAVRPTSPSEQESDADVEAINTIVNVYDMAMVGFLLPVTLALNFLALLVFGRCHSPACVSVSTSFCVTRSLHSLDRYIPISSSSFNS